MIFCAPISSLEQVRKWERFFCLCTHFYFSLPTEKFLRGQGEKYTWAEMGIDYCHLTKIYIAYFLSTNDLFATRISDRQESVFRVYGWCLTCVPLVLIGGTNVLLPEHNVAFTLAQQCPSLGTLQNRKVATFNFIKLKQQPLLICRSVRLRFYSSPFTFSSGMPINTGVLRVKGKVQPFTTLHRPSSFSCKRLRIYTLHN